MTLNHKLNLCSDHRQGRYEDLIVPVEVKSGATGRLRSLHRFMDQTPHQYAVRLYSGQLEISRIKTSNGKDVTLLNLPFYLAGSIPAYLEWMTSQ